MPVTPLHILSTLWLHFKKKQLFDPLALAISSSIIDLEPLLVLYFSLPFPSHGFWHSYFAASFTSPLLAASIYFMERKMQTFLKEVLRLFRLSAENFPYNFRIAILNCIIGVYFHIFLDGFTHRRYPYVLFPMYISSDSNPLWFGFNFAIAIELLTIGLSIYSIRLWMKRLS